MPGPSPIRPLAKPFITANQVTMARMILLPLGTILLYQGTRGQWIAVVSMTIVGCTDFVDGWLARRYGPTVLGGLMDPIADKMFVALTLLPALDLGWLPVPVVLLIFLREFVITAARTAYSLRDVSLKTSYLAKVKTWFQMIVAGLIFLINTSPDVARGTLGVGAALAVVGGVIFYAIKRRVWRGAVAFALSFGSIFAIMMAFGDHVTAQVIGWSTVAITWASGGTYLLGMKDLPGTLRFGPGDAVRLFGAVAMPVLACLLIASHQGPAWPVFSAVALEFSVGGLDNLLAHHKHPGSWALWGARVGLQALLLGAALWVAYNGGGVAVAALSYAAFAVSAVATVAIFAHYRWAYLGEASGEATVA